MSHRSTETCGKTAVVLLLSMLMSERFIVRFPHERATSTCIKALITGPSVNLVYSMARRWGVGSSVTLTVNRNTSRMFTAVFVAAQRYRDSSTVFTFAAISDSLVFTPKSL